MKLEKCSYCDGSGFAYDFKNSKNIMKCYECEGLGIIELKSSRYDATNADMNYNDPGGDYKKKLKSLIEQREEYDDDEWIS